MLFRPAIGLVLGLASFASSNSPSPAAAIPSASEWVIGPIVRGRNHSEGAPLHPYPRPGGGWYVDLPQRPSGIHYVTFRHGSLAGKRRIVMRYRIQAAPGVRILPSTDPNLPSMITPYFQRAGDNWSARGKYEAYRWYGTFATQSPIVPGDHQIIAPLNGNWTAVMSSSARTNPSGFRDAILNADEVGFVLGGGDGYGHGVYATGRARLVVTEFRVE
jgi:hypothetical protein